MKNKFLTWIGLGIAAAVVLVFALPQCRQCESTIAGKAAPDFDFELNGKPARLAGLRGNVVVLNFWATWCPPCVEEMPALNRLHQQLAAQGVVVLGVSVDEDAAAYDRFLRQQQIAFPTYRDPAKKISSTYGTVMFPETYIIGRDGRIARKIIGAQTWDSPDLVSYLQSLLRMK